MVSTLAVGELTDTDPLEVARVVDSGVGSLVLDEVVVRGEVDDVVVDEEDVLVPEEEVPNVVDAALPVVEFTKGNTAWTA